jgi:UDP-N-acetylglucosamine 4-epimerase
MSNLVELIKEKLSGEKKVWIVTGGAGFIGSHIAETLLALGQTVRVIDNLSTGKMSNIKYLEGCLKELHNSGIQAEFNFYQGSICDLGFLSDVIPGADFILHQGALGSVPRSIVEPLNSHDSNTTGFINIIDTARIHNVAKIVYASSSSVYGDSVELPKVESKVGHVLSPYAATKMINEIYADSYAACYPMNFVGLRYFNVFGPRQDPEGAYAAVIPRWIDAIRRGEDCMIYGDGETSRDFCYIDNVVFANIMSALTDFKTEKHLVFNVACGDRTTLTELHQLIGKLVQSLGFSSSYKPPIYMPFRDGDIKHSLANISHIVEKLNYKPLVGLEDGLRETIKYFLS